MAIQNPSPANMAAERVSLGGQLEPIHEQLRVRDSTSQARRKVCVVHLLTRKI